MWAVQAQPRVRAITGPRVLNVVRVPPPSAFRLPLRHIPDFRQAAATVALSPQNVTVHAWGVAFPTHLSRNEPPAAAAASFLPPCSEMTAAQIEPLPCSGFLRRNAGTDIEASAPSSAS